MNHQLPFKGGLRTKGIVKKSLPDKPLITVVTVVFNNEKYLEETILSVINQTYDNLEYLVIDGGSTDDTLEIVKKYDNKIDYWLSEKDENHFDAMNKGIRLARGGWIHILNSDDQYLTNDALEKVVKRLDNSGRKFYYFSMFLDYWGTKKKYQPPAYNFLTYLRLYYSAYIPHPALFVMKKQYQETGLYHVLPLNIAADHEMTLRLCKKYQPVFTDIPVTLMKMGGISGQNLIKTFEHFKEITIQHGLNYWLAELIFKFKVLKYKLVVKKKLEKLRNNS